MSEYEFIQGHPTAHSHQHRGSERNDSSVLCDVATVIEDLNDEQWIAVTGGMSDVARLRFVEISVGMISGLSRSAFQMFKPIVQILESKQPQLSGTTDSPQKRSPLNTPFVHALCVEILQEVKGAFLVALQRVSLSGQYTGPGDGFMARCVELKEETVRVFFSRLDALDLSVQKPKASRLLDTRVPKALRASHVTREVVATILSIMERSCLDCESATAAACLSRVVAGMVRVLASPKAYGKLPLSSYYRAIEQVPPIHLTSDFQVQVHKAVLHVLLRSVRCPLVESQIIPKAWENAVLSYLTTARTILIEIVDAVLEVLSATEVSEESFSTGAYKMFSKVKDRVKQFMALKRRTGLSDSKGRLPALRCVTVATEHVSGEAPSCDSSMGMDTAFQQPTKAAATITKELNQDVRDALPKKMIPKERNHKKYFSRRRNAVGSLAPNQACPQNTETLRQNHLQDSITFTASVVNISNGNEVPGSSSQMENACAPDAVAKTPKKRNIFTRFFLSITKPLQTCIKSSE